MIKTISAEEIITDCYTHPQSFSMDSDGNLIFFKDKKNEQQFIPLSEFDKFVKELKDNIDLIDDSLEHKHYRTTKVYIKNFQAIIKQLIKEKSR